ncbi:MAG: 8-oxo-dGTP diphosphatase [Thermoplasmata archaeon]|jgi:8-oxo-dGTP pyrophosphatase MutT (NUDIX family)|nr:8-oxo-dGTP diphosphatase [Thermoplasmata archaeon]
MTALPGLPGPVPGAAPARKEYTVIVAVRQARDGKEFLMVDHKQRGWELPGGKLEGMEGPVHCALREFREETGHLLASPKFVMKLAKENGTCYVFTGGLGAAVDGEADGSVGEFRWFTRLPRGERLAFPDDPYAEMGARLGIDFG